MRHRARPLPDLLSMKGERQLTMLRVMTLEEAEAAEKARHDLVSVRRLPRPRISRGGPSVFAFPGLEYGDHVDRRGLYPRRLSSAEGGGDAVYCAASLSTVRRMREEGIPVCGLRADPFQGHLDRRLSRRRQTAASALEIWRQTKALEEAGLLPPRSRWCRAKSPPRLAGAPPC